jgi:hypothetical protein
MVELALSLGRGAERQRCLCTVRGVPTTGGRRHSKYNTEILALLGQNDERRKTQRLPRMAQGKLRAGRYGWHATRRSTTGMG